ncbi:type III polyketide synthase [Negadavirga shengliensis]|uniref:Type III polyketide synthase n=1 Tax=Negadavirga shengliensis TaxID=1389218 RepID=A0ABV9T5P2_9BACT
MQSHIVSIGLANPGAPIPQEKICRFMQMAHGLNASDSRKLNFIYKLSEINSRHSALEDFRHQDPAQFAFFPKNMALEPFPGTKKRMSIFQKVAPSLGISAISECLDKSGVSPGQITHLILVSCTGMYAPGVEMDIIQKMGFKSTIERYAIHFMGCYAAFNAIKLADRICKSEPKAKVLILSVELCTIHFQKDYNEDNMIANAIFGDGAAAILVTHSNEGIKIKGYESDILNEGEPDMAWHIGDYGFEMKLSKYVPELLDKGVKLLKEKMESKFNLSTIKNFAIHPGGTQILKKVEVAFGIDRCQNIHAHEVLRRFGNMSSASILFVLSALMDDASLKGDVLAMGFGPGLSMETLLIEKI